MYFPEVLRIIAKLNSHGTTATEENILEKLCEVKDGLERDKLRQISDLVDYACNVSYVSIIVLSDDVSSYKLNKDLEFSTTCDYCGELLEPFIPENFVIDSNVDYVSRATFEELTKNLNDF